MPVHDWANVPPGLFHHFRQTWTLAICDYLNGGGLPHDHMALIPLPPNYFIPDLSLSEVETYAARANRIAIHAGYENVVSMVEIVSPGDKASPATVAAFCERIVKLLEDRIHVLLIDLFPVTPNDPLGLHAIIWDKIYTTQPRFSDVPPFVAAYLGYPAALSHVVAIEVGKSLPKMPIFLRDRVENTLVSEHVDNHLPDLPLYLRENTCVSARLEESYVRAWEKMPDRLKAIVAGRSA